jgi:hypothetical protein
MDFGVATMVCVGLLGGLRVKRLRRGSLSKRAMHVPVHFISAASFFFLGPFRTRQEAGIQPEAPTPCKASPEGGYLAGGSPVAGAGLGVLWRVTEKA